MAYPEAELKAAYEKLVATRDRIERGELGWDALGEFFTEDAVFIDPAWGRIEGRPAILRFLVDSMQGLDDWTFPHQWTVVDGARVVSCWMNRLPGSRPDGSFYEARGVSILDYAGNGRFSREEDLLNMVHVFELMKESAWKPTGPLKLPPAEPRR